MNAFVIVGEAGAFTFSVAELLPVPAVCVCVVVTPPSIRIVPALLLVTLNVTVQVPLAGILIPVKLIAVSPTSTYPAWSRRMFPNAPATALILTRVSENAPPVRAVVLVLVRVRVTSEVPPD